MSSDVMASTSIVKSYPVCAAQQDPLTDLHQALLDPRLLRCPTTYNKNTAKPEGGLHGRVANIEFDTRAGSWQPC